jgi:mono/diheme cytochrome c family protein
MKYPRSTEFVPGSALVARVPKRLLRPVTGWISVACISAAILASAASAQPAKATGAALFQQKGCSHCHTIAGAGGTKGPNLSDVGSRLTVPRMEHQMLAGGLNMPPFRDALTLKEVRQLAGFLATCRSSQSTAVAERSPSTDPPSTDPDDPEKSFQ